MSSPQDRRIYSPGAWCLALAFMFGMMAGGFLNGWTPISATIGYIVLCTLLFYGAVHKFITADVRRWLLQKVTLKKR
jgi:hypothetical protein